MSLRDTAVFFYQSESKITRIFVEWIMEQQTFPKTADIVVVGGGEADNRGNWSSWVDPSVSLERQVRNGGGTAGNGAMAEGGRWKQPWW